MNSVAGVALVVLGANLLIVLVRLVWLRIHRP
mgnify:CR=1 FL=1